MHSTPEAGWLSDDRTDRSIGSLSGAWPSGLESDAEARLRDLNGAEAALVLAGPGAAVAHTLTASTNPGGHVIVSATLGGAVREFVAQDLAESGRAVSFADCGDVDAVAGLIRAETQLILTESLTDPGMRPIPVNQLATLAHGTDLQLIVDNSLLSPAHLRPLDLGATVVVEAVGPYLDGGAGLELSTVCGPRRLLRRVGAHAVRTGGRADPLSSRMLAQALRSLELRMAAHHRHADEVAEFLRKHAGVVAVDRASHDAAPWTVETHAGFGGVLSFTARVPLSPERTGGHITLPAWDSYVDAGRGEQAGVTLGLVRVAAGHDGVTELIERLRTLLAPGGHSMIAGVDLTGWRDLVATVRHASWEAQAGFGVSGTPAAAGSVIRVRPMLLGPTRVARPFTFGTGADALTPGALLLAALAADAAATAAISLALQGALPTRIGVRGHADPAAGLGLDLAVSGVVTRGRLATAAEHIRRFCVVYRTLADPAGPRLLMVTPGGSRPLDAAGRAEPPAFVGHVEAYAEWASGPRSTVTTGGRTVVSDRPKQLFGADRGPSPEEYLIAALAAETLAGLPAGEAELHVSARLDLRGQLGFEGAPVGLRDLLVQCLASDAMTDTVVPGPVLRLLRQANDIEMTTRLDATPDPRWTHADKADPR